MIHPSSLCTASPWVPDTADPSRHYCSANTRVFVPLSWLPKDLCPHREVGQKPCSEGTSPVVQWLRLRLPMQGARVLSLVGELRSHMPQPKIKTNKNKKQNKQKTVLWDFSGHLRQPPGGLGRKISRLKRHLLFPSYKCSHYTSHFISSDMQQKKKSKIKEWKED